MEIDFLEFCDRVTNSVNQDVGERARRLLKEHLDKRTNALYNKLDEVTEAMDTFINEGYAKLK